MKLEENKILVPHPNQEVNPSQNNPSAARGLKLGIVRLGRAGGKVRQITHLSSSFTSVPLKKEIKSKVEVPKFKEFKLSQRFEPKFKKTVLEFKFFVRKCIFKIGDSINFVVI